ncbi:metallophosphoesterase [Pigmentiphaga litoralis]|jgi:DNA repair exonuclease SbcCD nuclease subunit|uniref:metallophosphoesterase family protein n=1 Tax=Pigmentiphaga litoralis TaxID=516702 RepID=UPI00167BBA84|nr:DNA repair exonuclease [Pigmentiphaga litoralis]GGX04656.1 metallophosphoesterase [Pigmentiphaga litoralis]
MKFIHTADIHLDSPLVGLSAYQDAPADLLRTATRDAFTRLIDDALTEAVDFMVISGDLYDGNWKDFNTGLFFVREMGRLRRAGIPVYLLLGNHDAESEMTRKLQLPDNVHVFETRKAHTLFLEPHKVALHGRSFKDAATTDNLAATYPAYAEGYLNIGMLHTALEGNAAHANYAPTSIAELEAKGYEYWALGHVHEHVIHRGKSTIVFPGNLQGRHIRETGPRGAVLVTAEGNEIQSVDRMLVDVLRWHALEVDVTEADSFVDAIAAVGRALDQVVADGADGRPLALRVTLHGASRAHGALFGLEAQLRAEVLALATALGSDRVWIEKLKIRTTPAHTASLLAERSDALSDLQALLAEAPQSQEFLDSLLPDLQAMVNKLPLDVLKSMPELERIRSGDLSALLDDVTPGLLAHLASAGESR